MELTTSFIHLHTHTEYSFLDSTIRIHDLVETAKQFNMPALAITDHGGLFGAMAFNNECLRQGIKPILGMEAYVAPGSRFEKNPAHSNFHLVLLAENSEGWKNLMALSSIGWLEGFCHKPRIDMDALRTHSAGLIATSACACCGAIPRALAANNYELAKKTALNYLDIFGERNFFLEINNHGTVDETLVADGLIKLGRELGIPLVAANDVHYLKHEHAASHELLLCIRNKTTLSDPNRHKFPSDQYYFKSPAEMAALFPHLPMALRNTIEIADRCDVSIRNEVQVPSSEIQGGIASTSEMLRLLAREKLPEKYPQPTQDLKERLEYELAVICTNKYADYLLLIKDFIDYAAHQGTITCVRGSAAGSLVAYAIGITDMDPIQSNLLFERFINPERPRLAFIGLWLPCEFRSRLVDYAISRYGSNAVCEPYSLQRMRPRRLLRKIAAAMGIPVEEANNLSAMVDMRNLWNRRGQYEKLRKTGASSAGSREFFTHAALLDDIAEKPAFGEECCIAIASGNTMDRTPLLKLASSDRILAQFETHEAEYAGLLLIETWGLRDLTLLQETLRLIAKHHGTKIDLPGIPYDDRETLGLFNRGETEGVFMFTSKRLQKYLRRFDSVTFNDLTALTSLFRPGPMDYINSYIKRRNGKEKTTFLHPFLEEILESTCGIAVFQEQIMCIAQRLGGLTLGLADIFRKALGKRDATATKKFRDTFITGATNRNIPLAVASDVFDFLAQAGPFGFNQSHATLSTGLSYRIGYLKAHYPKEFLTAWRNTRLDDGAEMKKVEKEALRLGIEIEADKN